MKRLTSKNSLLLAFSSLSVPQFYIKPRRKNQKRFVERRSMNEASTLWDQNAVGLSIMGEAQARAKALKSTHMWTEHEAEKVDAIFFFILLCAKVETMVWCVLSEFNGFSMHKLYLVWRVTTLALMSFTMPSLVRFVRGWTKNKKIWNVQTPRDIKL